MLGRYRPLTHPHRAGLDDGARLTSCVAGLLLLGSGLLHLSAAGDHTNLPVMMAGFLVVAALQAALGGLVIMRRARGLLVAAGLALTLGSLGAWLLSRTAGLPFLPGGHMEPIGFKDGITVLFEVATVPFLALLMSSELNRVSLPSSRLGAQALGLLGSGMFALLVPAFVLGGGEHHSAAQMAAAHGHGGAHDSGRGGLARAGSGHEHGDGAGGAAGHAGHGGSGGGGHEDDDGGHGDDHAAGSTLASSGSGAGAAHGGAEHGHGRAGGGAGDHGDDHAQQRAGGGRGGAHGEHGGRRNGERDHGNGRHGKGGHGPGGGDRGGAGHGGAGDGHGSAAADHGGGDGDHGDGGHGGGQQERSIALEEGEPGKNGRGPAVVFHDRGDERLNGGHAHGGSCRPTPGQRAAADRIYRATAAELKKYENNPARALADGFDYVFGPTDRMLHMVHLRRLRDPDVLVANEIESFVYYMTDTGFVPIAGMFVLPRYGMQGPQPGGCLTRWHHHGGLIARWATLGTQGNTPQMMHVFTYPGLDPWGHYNGRDLAHLWTPGRWVPSVCRQADDANSGCLP